MRDNQSLKAGLYDFLMREAITVEDVLWSNETLGTIGHPRYHTAWGKVAKAEAVGPRTVRFTFTEPDREMPSS